MVSLIIAVISIAFFASILVAGMHYVSFDAIRGMRDGGQIQHGFVQLSTGYLTFRELHRDEPASLDDLVPSLLREPPLPAGLTWDYDESGRDWFCVKGTVDKTSLRGLQRAQGALPGGATFLASSCGAKENAVPPSVFPATVALTYFVRIS